MKKPFGPEPVYAVLDGDYGLAIDPKTQAIWHSLAVDHDDQSWVAKLDRATGNMLALYAHGGDLAQGVVVDDQENVWVAHSINRRDVGHLRTSGTFVGNVDLGGAIEGGHAGPTGVAVDSNGKVWATAYNANSAVRINPSGGAIGGGGFPVGAVDLRVDLGDGLAHEFPFDNAAAPYNYSDMTGFVTLGSTFPSGGWIVVHDEGVLNRQWSLIEWSASTPGAPSGSGITVEVRAANTVTQLPNQVFTEIQNGEPFNPLTGRYLEIRVTFWKVPPYPSAGPILYWLNGPSAAAIGGLRMDFRSHPGSWPPVVTRASRTVGRAARRPHRILLRRWLSRGTPRIARAPIPPTSLSCRARSWAAACLTVGMVTAPVLGATAATVTPEDVAVGYAQRHVLLQFTSEAQSRLLEAGRMIPIEEWVAELGLPSGSSLEEPTASRAVRDLALVQETRPGESRHVACHFYYLNLPPGLDVPQCLALLSRHPHLSYVEPDRVGSVSGVLPNDAIFGSQWHHTNQTSLAPVRSVLRSPEAWDITQGSSNTIVAVLDTGIDLTLRQSVQLEFTGRLLPGYNFADGNGDVDDPDFYSHGTAVAGIVGANANNYVLGAGLDWNCRLLPVKVFDDLGNCLESWVAQGVDYAVARGAKVINFSGGLDDGPTLGHSISNAIAQGAIFVCASGNWGIARPPFPASYGPSIAVGASDEQDCRASFSNWGQQLDLIAPGVRISSTRGGLNGTSYAAPMVSGVCSLLASVRPDLNQEQALTLLGAGAEDQLGDAPGRSGGDGTDTPGWDEHHGWGRLNAYFSLLLATTAIDQVTPLADGRLELSWKSPINASTNQPYRVELAMPLDSTWTRVTNGTFRYEGYRTWWTEPDPAPTANVSRFYRVLVVLE